MKETHLGFVEGASRAPCEASQRDRIPSGGVDPHDDLRRHHNKAGVCTRSGSCRKTNFDAVPPVLHSCRRILLGMVPS